MKFLHNLRQYLRPKKNKFEIILKQISKSKNGITEIKRKRIYDVLSNIDSKDALILYKDMCYLYICACNDEQVDNEYVEKLTMDYSPSFIKSIVDVGNIIEKLADASCLDQDTRKQKWTEENQKLYHDKISHKENAEIINSWSSFSLSSRTENEKAYTLLRSQVSQINLPPTMQVDLSENWGQVIMLNTDALQKKPPHFFHTIHTNKLSILQKRALSHKLKLIQNIIPIEQRNIINQLDMEIFKSMQSKQKNTNSLKLKYCCFCF